MKKHILKRIKEKLELSYTSWADNYIVAQVHKDAETEESKKQLNLATENMKHYEKQIETLKQLEKKETKEPTTCELSD